MEDIFIRYNLNFMLYADDSQLYIVCDKPSDSVFVIEQCLVEIREWMMSNLLILNDDKTEVMRFTSRLKKNIEKLESLRIGGFDIIPTKCVRNLGVFFDSTGDLSSQVNQICKVSYSNLYRISKLRSVLDQSSTEKLIHAFITSRLDYCNSIFYGCPEYELSKLQAIQNSAARLVMKRRKHDHISPIFFELHWLPVRQRIIFKILLIVYKILSNQAPFYLSNLIELYVPGRSDLRSANPDFCLLKRQDSRFTTKSYGWRAFNICAPFLWNELPLFIRNAKSVDIFKRNLKTYLFKKSY